MHQFIMLMPNLNTG